MLLFSFARSKEKVTKKEKSDTLRHYSFILLTNILASELIGG